MSFAIAYKNILRKETKNMKSDNTSNSFKQIESSQVAESKFAGFAG